MRLASPSLPVGGFSYSEGLESAVEAGLVSDEASAARWLVDQLALGLARSDLPVVARGARRLADAATSPSVAALNQLVRDDARDRRAAPARAEQMGRSLALWLRHRGAADARLRRLEALPPAPTWPIAFALAAADSGATRARRPRRLRRAAGPRTWSQAAIKAVPLGQAAAQRILAALAAEIPAARRRRARASPAADMQAFTPMLAILSAQHEDQYSRLFRS